MSKTSTSTNSIIEANMVGMTGFEPVTSCVQGKASTKLNYVPIWLQMLDSNQRPPPYEGDEITTSTNPQFMADEDRLELSNTGAKNQ